MCIFILLSSKYYLISPVIFFFYVVIVVETLCTATRQACLFSTISQSWLNLCPFSRWCHPTNSSSVSPFSSCPPSLPASGSFLMSWLFASFGQSIGASASASVLPMNIQSWFPLELSGLISLLSKGLSRVFSSTTIGKHQFLHDLFWTMLPNFCLLFSFLIFLTAF